MIDDLRAMYPWPNEKPEVESDEHHWFGGRKQRVMKDVLTRINPKLIVETGSWLGKSSRYMLDNSNATVICIDHWRGSSTHQHLPQVAACYEIFLVNNWEYRNRIIPVRLETMEGFRKLKELKVEPDLFFLDADHQEESVAQQHTFLIENYPSTPVLGDDWGMVDVRKGVYRTLYNYPQYKLKTHTVMYEVCP